MCRKIINNKNACYLLAFFPPFLDIFHIKKSIKHFFFRVVLSNNSTRLYQNPRNRFAKTLRSASEWFIEFCSHDLITLRTFQTFSKKIVGFFHILCVNWFSSQHVRKDGFYMEKVLLWIRSRAKIGFYIWNS